MVRVDAPLVFRSGLAPVKRVLNVQHLIDHDLRELGWLAENSFVDWLLEGLQSDVLAEFALERQSRVRRSKYELGELKLLAHHVDF